jgi:signal recognition particle receptor subunit alpha
MWLEILSAMFIVVFCIVFWTCCRNPRNSNPATTTPSKIEDVDVAVKHVVQQMIAKMEEMPKRPTHAFRKRPKPIPRPDQARPDTFTQVLSAPVKFAFSTAKTASQKGSSILHSINNLLSGHIATEETIVPIANTLHDKLLSRNVSLEVTDALVHSVRKRLIGSTVPSFTLLSTIVYDTMAKELATLLKTPPDLIHEIKTREHARPYVIVMVGVNGVGKSTSLGKLAAYFSSNDVRCGIIACDSFRSGAVEQLKVHSETLQVPLFERGYQKDPTSIAIDGIMRAEKDLNLDVVIVDTAGRQQRNVSLMKALSKLLYQVKPNQVIFVGEALVGNDGIDQVVEFDRAFADNASVNANIREITGLILTKCDTVDNKLGAIVSMAHVLRKPVLFLGTGQTYTDLLPFESLTIIQQLLA